MNLSEEISRFLEHMPPNNDLTLITLKGHLLIEEMLERVIRTILAHGEFLPDAKLSFAQKATIAKSMCWAEHNNAIWDVIFSFNALRNEFAHQLESPKVTSKLQRTLNLYLQAIDDPAIPKDLAHTSEPQQLKDAAVCCMGFLSKYEEHAKFYRSMVDTLFEAGRSFSQSAPEV